MASAPKKASSDQAICGLCGSGSKLAACSRCGLVAYCSKDCQKAHWKDHKPNCVPKADRVPSQPSLSPAATASSAAALPAARASAAAAAGGDECAICLEELAAASTCTLPCGHVFHPECVEQLRSCGVQSLCPLCRAELPPGPEKQSDEASDRFAVLQAQVAFGKQTWTSLMAQAKPRREMVEIAKLYTEAAEQGYAAAQFNLGILNMNGYCGFKKSDKAAVQWFSKAAEQNKASPSAILNLGIFHEQGRGGLRRNDAAAVKCYERAAALGLPEAMYSLGICHVTGQGAKTDDAKGGKWFLKAAEQGHMQAQHNLAILLDRKGDLLAATPWFAAAAAQGDDHAMVAMGKRYHMGIGVARPDKALAETWYKKCLARKTNQSPQANLMLGQLYEQSFKDPRRAAVHYRLAAAAPGDGVVAGHARMLLERLHANEKAKELLKSYKIS